MNEPVVASLLSGLRSTTLADSQVRFSALMHRSDPQPVPHD